MGSEKGANVKEKAEGGEDVLLAASGYVDPVEPAASRLLSVGYCHRQSRGLPRENCSRYGPGQDVNAGPLLKNDQEFQSSSKAANRAQDPPKCGTLCDCSGHMPKKPALVLPNTILPLSQQRRWGPTESEQLPRITQLAGGRGMTVNLICAAPEPRDLNHNKPLTVSTVR